MAHSLCLVLLAAGLALASGANTPAAQDPSIAALASQVQKQGQELPAAVQKALTAALDKIQAARKAAEASEEKSAAAPSKAAVTALIGKLDAIRQQERASFDAFVKQQGTQAGELVQKYLDLIKARQAASGAAQSDEKQIVALRKAKQDLLLKWENDFVALISKNGPQVLAAVKAAAADPKQKEAIKAAAGRLLVTNIADALAAVTTTQAVAVENFVIVASKVLHRLALKAQLAAL